MGISNNPNSLFCEINNFCSSTVFFYSPYNVTIFIIKINESKVQGSQYMVRQFIFDIFQNTNGLTDFTVDQRVISQEAQLSQRDRATLLLIEYFVTQDHSKRLG